MLINFKIFYQVSEHETIWMPHNHPGTDFFIGIKEVELFAQFHMIPFFCLFKLIKIGF